MAQQIYHKTCFEGNGAYYWTRVFLLIVIRGICAGETLIVKSCPTTRLSWEDRSENFTCNTQNGYSYHCILDDTEELVEDCVARIQVPLGKVGCPEVTIYRGVAHHSHDNSECPSDNTYCPSGKTAYFSDQLYMYPICFLNVSSRAQYTEETSETINKSTENKDLECSKSKEGSSDSPENSSTVAIVLGLLLGLSMIANGIALVFFCRRKIPKD